MSLHKRKLTDLVEENYVYASVLYHFGIEFYNYSEQTLEQVCQGKSLNKDQIIDSLESVSERGDEHDVKLMSLPIELIVAYLKHKHYMFVKQTLPYLAKLISSYPAKSKTDVINDIKLVFPLFVEDFIQHMHAEEDSVFKYVLMLNKVSKGDFKPANLYYEMEKNSISKFADHHDGHDDEMQGIRRLTKDYVLYNDSPVLQKVIYEELKSFERDLNIHARVENEILFPKALLLEKQVKQLVRQKVVLN